MFRDFPIIFMISALVYILCFPIDPQTALETFLKLFAYLFVGCFVLKYIFERWFL